MGGGASLDAVPRFSRITTDPSRMDGVPCIRGLRFPVATVVAMVVAAVRIARIAVAVAACSAVCVIVAAAKRLAAALRNRPAATNRAAAARACSLVFVNAAAVKRLAAVLRPAANRLAAASRTAVANKLLTAVATTSLLSVRPAHRGQQTNAKRFDDSCRKAGVVFCW